MCCEREFLPIGFHVALILNRMRCEAQLRALEEQNLKRGNEAAKDQNDGETEQSQVTEDSSV